MSVQGTITINQYFIMKRFLILAGLAVLASAVSSCDENGNLITPQMDVDINSSSDVYAEDLLDLKSEAVAYDAPSNVYYVETSASSTLRGTVALSSTPATLSGALEINNAKLPESAQPKDGSLAQGALVLILDNPADEKVVASGKVEADDVKFNLPEFTVNSGSREEFRFVSINSSEKLIPGASDNYVTLPEPGKALDKGPSKIVVSDIVLSKPSTKAIAPAGGSYEFKVDAKYIAPLIYTAGAKIHLNRTFTDLKISLDRVNYPCPEYDIIMDVENTLPFDINFTVSSAEGIDGTLKNVIKAGSLENPVTTSVVLNVKDSSGKAVSNINTADLGVDLTAVEGASLQKGQKLGLKVSKVTIIKVL